MTIAIVTDSTASLSRAEATEFGIHIVPISVVIGAKVHTEGVDVTSDMIADALKSFVPVSTSRPSAETFDAVYKSLAASGVSQIVSIHLSGKMSGTVESAQLAADRCPIPVHVVDSQSVALATGFSVLRAARAAAQGADIDTVVAAAQATGKVRDIFLYVDSLEYLRRGGRIGTAAVLIGSALSMKPILTVADGMVAPLDKVRTASRALARIVALTADAAKKIQSEYDVAVQHLGASGPATKVAEQLVSALGAEEIRIDEVGASLGAHVGPGMIAVSIAER